MNLPLLLRAYVFLGLIEAGVAMGAFFLLLMMQGWTWGTPLDWSDPLYKQATAATFAAIVVAQVANVFACRSDRVPLSRLGWFTNPLLLWGIATELVVLAFIIYTPWGNAIFGTSPLPVWIFGPLALGALVLLGAEESRKFIVNRFTNRRTGEVTR
jgi:sodium/potassium-transporting ATPase subunit alpha